MLNRRLATHSREALRSLIISQRAPTLQMHEIAVFHHTDCGMTNIDTFALRGQILAAHPGNTAVSTTLEEINFKPIGSLNGSVKDDVNFLWVHPLILNGDCIIGWEYDVKTGRVCI